MSEGKLQVVVLTGLAGSGKTTALHALEDAGFFCVDNLPTPLVPPFLRLCQDNASVRRVGLAIDIRDRPFLGDLEQVIEVLDAADHEVSIVFLESSNEAIINRFKTTRRPHPVMAQRLAPHLDEAIRLERTWLMPFAARATLTVDTSAMSVHDLRQLVHRRFGSAGSGAMALQVCSFGFRNGVPPESDFVFDARFLENPYFIDELRDKTGLDPEVAAFVMDQPLAARLLDHIAALLLEALPAIEREKRALLTIAIGCTGGHHRSVALAVALSGRLGAAGHTAEVRHRDIHRGP